MAVTLAGAGAGCFLHSKSPQLLRRSALQEGFDRTKSIKVAGSPLAVSELVEASQSVQAAPDLSWQIIAGAVAGVTPFVVAGIEFSKRIAAQQRCSTCGGSGLVKKGDYYFRCGSCGDSYHGTPGDDSSKDDKWLPSSCSVVSAKRISH